MNKITEIKVVEVTLQTSKVDEKNSVTLIPTASIKLNFEKSPKQAISLKNLGNQFENILTEFLKTSIGEGYTLSDMVVTPDNTNPYSSTRVDVNLTSDPSGILDKIADTKLDSKEVKSTINLGRPDPIPAPVGNVVSDGMNDLFKGTSWGNK